MGEKPLRIDSLLRCDEREATLRIILCSLPVKSGKDWIATGSPPIDSPWYT